MIMGKILAITCFFCYIGHATEMLGDICGVNRIWIGIYTDIPSVTGTRQ